MWAARGGSGFVLKLHGGEGISCPICKIGSSRKDRRGQKEAAPTNHRGSKIAKSGVAPDGKESAQKARSTPTGKGKGGGASGRKKKARGSDIQWEVGRTHAAVYKETRLILKLKGQDGKKKNEGKINLKE